MPADLFLDFVWAVVSPIAKDARTSALKTSPRDKVGNTAPVQVVHVLLEAPFLQPLSELVLTGKDAVSRGAHGDFGTLLTLLSTLFLGDIGGLLPMSYCVVCTCWRRSPYAGPMTHLRCAWLDALTSQPIRVEGEVKVPR